MKKLLFSSLLLPVLLAACVHAPHDTQEKSAAKSQALKLATDTPAMMEAEKEQAYPKMELSSQMLYTFLLADIAAQRGQTELAAQAYLELAKTTRDLRVVRRAAQLTYESRQMEQALEAFTLWNELEPQALMPKKMLASVLVSGGRLEQARPYLLELLAADPKNAGRIFMQIYPLFAQYGDKAVVHKILRELAQPYTQFAEIHWVIAQAAEDAKQHDEALREVRLARSLRPEWELPVLLEAQLLLKKSPLVARRRNSRLLA